MSKKTGVDWYNFLRDVCAQYYVDHPNVIGGPGIEVEIDESKFGRRKISPWPVYMWKVMHWVFGGTERITGKAFLVEVESTLIPSIRQHIRTGIV